MSSDGKVHVGAIACRELVPQPWKLTDKFPAELDALHKAATSGRTPKKAASEEGSAKKKPAAKKTPRRSRRPRSDCEEGGQPRPDSPDRKAGQPRVCERSVRSGLPGIYASSRCAVPDPGRGDVDGLEERRDEAVGLYDAAGVAAGCLVDRRAGDPAGEPSLARGRDGAVLAGDDDRGRYVDAGEPRSRVVPTEGGDGLADGPRAGAAPLLEGPLRRGRSRARSAPRRSSGWRGVRSWTSTASAARPCSAPCRSGRPRSLPRGAEVVGRGREDEPADDVGVLAPGALCDHRAHRVARDDRVLEVRAR